MSKNKKFISLATTQSWLSQFDSVDQEIVVDLLREMKLVSRDDFSDGLRDLLSKQVQHGSSPVGIYVERELRSRDDVPHRLFEEEITKIESNGRTRESRKAVGGGPQPVQPTKFYDPKVGSEGLVAQIVSEICSQYAGRAAINPGPDAIRKKRIRRFIIVTDFIGSGERIRKYLEAAWRVRSVRSWSSTRSRKGMAFEVIAYSASNQGQATVEGHRSKPVVHIVAPTPTIECNWSKRSASDFVSICVKYSPTKASRFEPLGYMRIGALISFAHGIPNNAPAIFHKKGRSWTPLFALRASSASASTFTKGGSVDEVNEQLLKLGQKRLANARRLAKSKPGMRNVIFALAALRRTPRTPEMVAWRTGLNIMEAQAALKSAQLRGWINSKNILTDAGQAELRSLRKSQSRRKIVFSDPSTLYIPTSLRAPSGVSS